MTFSGLTFIFLFLPVFCLLYYLLPKVCRVPVLLIASIIFYSYGKPRNLLIMAAIVIFDWAVSNIFFGENISGTFRKVIFIIGICVNVLTLGIYKYAGLEFPLGLSFYVFSSISYLADVYREDAQPEKNPMYLACYIAMFSKVTSGPIVQYRKMRDELHNIAFSRTDFLEGMMLFLKGLVKKMLLADALGNTFAQFSSLQAGTTVVSAWMMTIFYSFQLYFDFSGYSDMAIGLSQMMGFKFDKNFDHPYLSVSVTEFWRRWHISLGAWFRDYVYIPLGGNRCSRRRQIMNLSAVWILTGIWHGSTLNFIVWGIYHGVFIILEKHVLRERINKFPSVIRILLVDLEAFVGWIFFFMPTLLTSVRHMGNMIGINVSSFADRETMFVLAQNLVLLIAALICSGSIPERVQTMLLRIKKGKAGVYITAAIYMLLFALCISGIISSTYSTFLYAKF